MLGAWKNLRRRLACFIDAPTPPAVLPPLPMPRAMAWTAAHQKAWYAFLGTPAGLALMQRMMAMAAANARAGAQDAMNATHSAGRSAGFYDAIEWLESQARIEFEAEPLSGEDADQPATSAHELQGEAQLRAHYSP